MLLIRGPTSHGMNVPTIIATPREKQTEATMRSYSSTGSGPDGSCGARVRGRSTRFGFRLASRSPVSVLQSGPEASEALAAFEECCRSSQPRVGPGWSAGDVPPSSTSASVSESGLAGSGCASSTPPPIPRRFALGFVASSSTRNCSDRARRRSSSARAITVLTGVPPRWSL